MFIDVSYRGRISSSSSVAVAAPILSLRAESFQLNLTERPFAVNASVSARSAQSHTSLV